MRRFHQLSALVGGCAVALGLAAGPSGEASAQGSARLGRAGSYSGGHEYGTRGGHYSGYGRGTYGGYGGGYGLGYGSYGRGHDHGYGHDHTYGHDHGYGGSGRGGFGYSGYGRGAYGYGSPGRFGDHSSGGYGYLRRGPIRAYTGGAAGSGQGYGRSYSPYGYGRY